MLKCAVLYIPGSGGSFLRRALSLSDKTIFESSTESVNAEQKFQCFNHWNMKNWKSAEKLHRPNFRNGSEHFYEFENGPLAVIDAWHPTEFLRADQDQSAWSTGAWPNLVFLHVDSQLREFFMQNQKTKSYHLDWHQEQQDFFTLKNLYRDRAINIDFYELCDRQKFHDCITRLDQLLDLELRVDLALELWKNWFTQSQLIWIK